MASCHLFVILQCFGYFICVEPSLLSAEPYNRYVVNRVDDIEEAPFSKHLTYKNEEQSHKVNWIENWLRFVNAPEGASSIAPGLPPWKYTQRKRFRRQDTNAKLREKERTIQLYLVCDSACYTVLKKHMEEPEQYLYKVVKEADKRMARIFIKIVLVGLEIWSVQERIKYEMDITKKRNDFGRYRTTVLLNRVWSDASVLVTGYDVHYKSGTAAGVFSLGGICTSDYGAGVIKYVGQSAERLAQTLVHELGHGLGMNHDTKDCCDLGAENCVMAAVLNNYQVAHYRFSRCSVEQLLNYLSTPRSVCLNDRPTQAYTPSSESLCGNGVVDPGEQCDCGQSCTFGCCECCSKCRLKAKAQCFRGQCCNVQTCQYRQKGYQCRKQSDKACDVEDSCGGNSSECVNHVEEDGTNCTDSSGITSLCWKGKCLTRNNQCENTWKTGYSAAHSQCYEHSTIFSSKYAHCGSKPNSQFYQCSYQNTKNYQCGLLQCRAPPGAKFGTDGGYHRRPQKNIFISQHQCLSLKHGDWESKRGPVMVADGTPCGQGKVCWKTDCLDQDQVFRDLKKNKEKNATISSTCGDGVITLGEECDCGAWFQRCGCCDPVTCKLLSPGTSCLYPECQLCDGKNVSCSGKEENFKQCGSGDGNCYQGRCVSVADKCTAVFGPQAQPDLKTHKENSQYNSSQANGGGYLLYNQARRRWDRVKEFVTATSDGICGVLLCKTDQKATVKDEAGDPLQSVTFYAPRKPADRVAYFFQERIIRDASRYKKYFPVLVDEGTRCSINGKAGYCHNYNLKLDSKKWNWYWFSKCLPQQ